MRRARGDLRDRLEAAARRPLRERLLLALLLPTLPLFVAGWLGHRQAALRFEEQLGAHLESLAAVVATQLSPRRVLTIEPGDDRIPTRTYTNLLNELEASVNATGARRAFVVEAERGSVLADSKGTTPVGTPLPDLSRDLLELEEVRAGRTRSSAVLFEGSDGALYKTGYAPLIDEGQVVAIVGVEGSAAFFAPLRRLLWTSLLLTGAALALVVLGAAWNSERLTRPLRTLVASAVRIGRGDLETGVPAQPGLEIGTLSSELESMRLRLRARERQLQTMLAGVAHEVRNPLGGITLFAGLLEEELNPEPTSEQPDLGEARAHLARIRTELAYLDKVVSTFLAFAREQPLERVEVEARRLLEGARDHVTGVASERRVDLALEVATARLRVDETLVVTAVVNLLKNAVLASPDGGTVRLEGVADGPRYRIRVRDSGPGVPEGVRERIFEPFFTTREQGSGLGLPLAAKVALAHDGSLTVLESDRGACFELVVPIGPGPVDPRPVDPEPVDPQTGAGPPHRSPSNI